MPPRLRTFISAERTMAETVVSAVKPGGQALEVCPSGFLVLAGACNEAGARRWRCGVGLRVDKPAFRWRLLHLHTYDAVGRVESPWGLRDNGRLAGPCLGGVAAAGIRDPSTRWRRSRLRQSLVPSHSVGAVVSPRCRLNPKPCENSLLCLGARPVPRLPRPPCPPCAAGTFVIHMVPCFHFFPAAKCPTHLK